MILLLTYKKVKDLAMTKQSPDLKTANKAIELIGKTIGAFNDSNETVIKHVNVNLNQKEMRKAVKEVLKEDDC